MVFTFLPLCSYRHWQALPVQQLREKTGAALAASHTSQCKYSPQEFPDGSLSYDITNLIPSADSGADFIWDDERSMDARNFTFQFNLCQNTFSKPSQSCNANLNAPAWQHDRNTDSCYALGGDLSGRVSQQALSIHDPRRPAAGFNLRYWGGQKDFCSENGESFSRSFTLAFMCEPTMTFPSPGPLPHEEFVRETSPCVYEAYSFSQSGCPTQCPVYDGKVCGGRGVCRYDTDAVQARCFCNDGYISDNGCKPVTVPSPAGGIAGGFFGGLALGGLGVAIWWFLTQRNQTPAGAEDYAYSGNLQ